MPAHLDHLILPVNDLAATLGFYTSILGFVHEGERPPFAVLRVNAELTLQVAPWGTPGGLHLAFSFPRGEFDAAVDRIRRSGLPYGDSFHAVGNQQGPGSEPGSNGPGEALYLFDPSRHLTEVRCEAG